MLLELYIRNFALIDEMRIEYEAGLNIITGETGSGKSIMIDALSLALGKKGSRSVVRNGAKKAVIEAHFNIYDEEITGFLEDLGIEGDEDRLTITREISSDGRSVSRVNGRIVNQSDLKDITTRIITIHGQNEYEQLLTPSNQLKLIDNFGGSETTDLLKEYEGHYQEFLNIRKKILLLNDDSDPLKIQRELDLLSYEIDEIREADIKRGEKEEIKEKLLRLENSEKIRGSLRFVYQKIYEEKDSILDVLSRCINKLEGVSEYLPKGDHWLEKLNEAYYSLEDISHEFNAAQEDPDDEEDIDRLNIRLDRVNQIHRKYGKDLDEVRMYLQAAIDRREEILSRDVLNQKYSQELDEIQQNLVESAEKLSRMRKEIALRLKKEIQLELDSLNMKDVQLEIDFRKRDFMKTGADQVEFLVSFNKGEEPKAFSQIASGGEISRFMLAFKTVVARSDNIYSLIFDEIDTGVSGLAAQKIGIKLKEISRFRQVLCITHLPQIASFADTHFVVEKEQHQQDTQTRIKKLNFGERVDELAKMMGGTEITKSTLQAAKDLILKNSERV
ncbi:MAG: DNA repair protein RecN [Peptostreptococcaceae bacterium]|nr:DNA repair protein RecN [Peptostreptococcaceae bacterium]